MQAIHRTINHTVGSGGVTCFYNMRTNTFTTKSMIETFCSKTYFFKASCYVIFYKFYWNEPFEQISASRI